MARMGSMIFITKLLLIKLAAILNSLPSPTSNNELIDKWTIKNNMRKIPVILIKNFCPMDEVKNLLIKFNFSRTLIILRKKLQIPVYKQI